MYMCVIVFLQFILSATCLVFTIQTSAQSLQSTGASPSCFMGSSFPNKPQTRVSNDLQIRPVGRSRPANHLLAAGSWQMFSHCVKWLKTPCPMPLPRLCPPCFSKSA